MSGLLGLDGVPVDPVDRAEHRLGEDIVESVFGVAPEARVYELRRSVLGDEAGERPSSFSGLAAWLPEEPPEGIVDVPLFGLERHPSLVKEYTR